MNIRITRLSMTNFKCFREKELCFDASVTTVRGRNGEGKTTVADAILFCLFGKNTAGQSDLELFKTREDGKTIPNLDHSVELLLSVDGGSAVAKEVSLRRSIKEVWVKKRGSEESVFKNNTVEYYVNGESYTKTDYEKYIASLIDERIFRAITTPTYFPSLKWQDQREFLTRMVGDIEPENFAVTEELKALVDYFAQHDENVEDYLKHLSYQIKELKKKLEKIPVRLEEQNKALPERLDWSALQAERDEVSARCKELQQKIASTQKGDGADIKRAEIRVKIENLRKQMNDIEDKARYTIQAATIEHNQKVTELLVKFTQELNNQKLMEQTLETDKRLIERCCQSMHECDEEIERLRLAWPMRRFSIDESKGFCPTCGQPLPEEQWIEKQNEMRNNFNKALEAEKQSLRDKAAKAKQTKEDAEKELETIKQKLAADADALKTIKENINTTFSEKAKEEKKPLPTFDDFLPANDEYQAALREREILQHELDAITDSDGNRELLDDLSLQLSQLSERLQQIQVRLATKTQYDRITSLIDGINDEQKDLVKQLSELEKREDTARQYQYCQNQLLEERINRHFSLVQWRLFRTVNNGGDSFEEPFCECYVGGQPYHAGLNDAAKLNGGLDIINTLCKHYNVAAPIVLDNAESTINILQTIGQQIRLQVFDSELSLV